MSAASVTTHHRRFGDSGRVPGSIARLNNGRAVASVSAIGNAVAQGTAERTQVVRNKPYQRSGDDRSSMRRGSFEGASGCGQPATPRQ
jgi:hypothetical protein